MGDTWISNVLHSLNEDGDLVSPPGPARRMAEYIGSIVQAVTEQDRHELEDETAIRCRRRPGHKRCEGRIVAFLDEADPMTIQWFCPICNDNGAIRGWQETLWDKRTSS